MYTENITKEKVQELIAIGEERLKMLESEVAERHRLRNELVHRLITETGEATLDMLIRTRVSYSTDNNILCAIVQIPIEGSEFLSPETVSIFEKEFGLNDSVNGTRYIENSVHVIREDLKVAKKLLEEIDDVELCAGKWVADRYGTYLQSLGFEIEIEEVQ